MLLAPASRDAAVSDSHIRLCETVRVQGDDIGVSPEVVMPIHTSSPDLYANFISDVGLKIEIPEDGMVYAIN
jgi:hypothetical protein